MKWRKQHKLPVFWAVLSQMFKYFCVVVTVLVVLNLANAWMTDNEWTHNRADLTHMLLMVLLSMVPMLLFVFFEGGIFLRLLHIFLTAGIPLIYLAISPPGGSFTTHTIVTFLIVFVAVYGFGYLKDRRVTIKINKKLDAFRHDENASKDGENAT